MTRLFTRVPSSPTLRRCLAALLACWYAAAACHGLSFAAASFRPAGTTTPVPACETKPNACCCPSSAHENGTCRCCCSSKEDVPASAALWQALQCSSGPGDEALPGGMTRPPAHEAAPCVALPAPLPGATFPVVAFARPPSAAADGIEKVPLGA
jgi:hypothetical protein